MSERHPESAGQRGVALVVCLALLLVLGIAGASAVRTTILEERVVRNASDALVAFQAAEAALREGEAFLAGSIDSTEHFTDTGNDGLWTPAPPGERERWALAGVWAPAGSRSRKVTNPVEAVAAQPRFIVERLASLEIAPSPHLVEESTVASEQRLEIFRVTGRGVGRSGAASAMVQGTYGMLL